MSDDYLVRALKHPGADRLERENGSIVEVYQTNGGEWAVDIMHQYGVTRVLLFDNREDAYECWREVAERSP